MQETISCDMTCPWEFQTSHKLGPKMSMTFDIHTNTSVKWGILVEDMSKEDQRADHDIVFPLTTLEMHLWYARNASKRTAQHMV
jgi:hypothetical protein